MTDEDAGSGATARGTSPVKSADRALALLSYVSERGPCQFGQILADLDLARSSAYGLIQTMVARGWLEHDPATKRYSLGLRAWQVGQRYEGHRDLADLARPIMDELVAETGETVQLARLDGVENIYIAISESPHPMRLASSVGMRLHAHATGLGKALLAQLDPDELRRRLSSVSLPTFTPHTLIDPDELMHTLADVRDRGYALDNEEYLEGCRCVAVAVRTGSPNLLAAMSITAPSMRCGPDWPERQRVAATAAARRIERRLTGQ